MQRSSSTLRDQAEVSSEEVERLHALLRKLNGRCVDTPGGYGSAPGYYAVYFTDDANMLKVEYVHMVSAGGGP